MGSGNAGRGLTAETFRMPVTRLIEHASHIFDVLAYDIVGDRRYSEIMAARNAVSLIAYEIGWPSPHIGRALGGREHTTVLSARDTALRVMRANAEYALAVEVLRAFALNPIAKPAAFDHVPDRIVAPRRKKRDAHESSDDRDRRTRREGSAKLLAALQREGFAA